MLLYYITDRRQLSQDSQEGTRLLLDRISIAANAGVDAVQLREQDLSARALVELGIRAAEIVDQANSRQGRGTRTRLLVNSRMDVALACRADGVHLRGDDVSAADARAVFSQAGVPQPLIGVSCHTLQEVELAESQGADFAVYGPVFEKTGTDAAGIANLETVCRKRRAVSSPMPVLALGGVTPRDASACLRAGAAGVAGIRLFQKGNLIETVSQLRSLAECV